MIYRLILLLLVAALIPQASAWWDEGHCVVAQIAYDHLTPEAKTECDALIATPIEPSTPRNGSFVTAACWADDSKRELKTGIWHYIDIPISLDGRSTTTARRNLDHEPMDVVRAIRLSTAMLQSTTATQQQKAPYLRYLIHFVGDIHQPCHCTTGVRDNDRGDRGGNDFELAGTWSNLHKLWDSGAGYVGDDFQRNDSGLTSDSQATLRRIVKELEAQHPYVDYSGTLPDPMDWALAGEVLGRQVVYKGLTRRLVPSPEYLAKAKAAAQQQLATAGYRLAGVLNTIYAAKPAAGK